MSLDESPQELVKQAEQALVNEEWLVALDLFNRSLALVGYKADQSELAEIQNGRGVSLLELGRFGEAIKAFETALTLKSAMSGVYYNLGLAWEGLGVAETALHNYNQAIEAEPHDGEAYFRRGGVWFALEQYDKTVEDTTKAIELHAEVVSGPYIARGLALYQLERYEEAIKDYTQAITVDPHGAIEAYFYRALVFVDKGEASPAHADLQAYLTLTDDLDGTMATQAREIISELEKLSE